MIRRNAGYGTTPQRSLLSRRLSSTLIKWCPELLRSAFPCILPIPDLPSARQNELNAAEQRFRKSPRPALHLGENLAVASALPRFSTVRREPVRPSLLLSQDQPDHWRLSATTATSLWSWQGFELTDDVGKPMNSRLMPRAEALQGGASC